jgi:hypothetical protein
VPSHLLVCAAYICSNDPGELSASAEAATFVVRMVNATRGFEADALALLNVAQDAVAEAATGGPLTQACGLADVGPDHPLHGLARAAAAVDVLIRAQDFAEGAGHEALLPLSFRSIRHYVASEPAGCWALNLVLVARGIVPPVTGLVPRTVFRLDLADAERAAALVAHSNREALAAFNTSSAWSRCWVAVATPLLAYHATPERLRPGRFWWRLARPRASNSLMHLACRAPVLISRRERLLP